MLKTVKLITTNVFSEYFSNQHCLQGADYKVYIRGFIGMFHEFHWFVISWILVRLHFRQLF